MDLDLEDFRLADVVQETVDLIIGKASDTEIHVHAEIEDGLGTIHADKRRIRQVSSTCSPTRAVHRAGRRDHHFREPRGKHGVLSVRDNGKGIEVERQASARQLYSSTSVAPGLVLPW